MDTVSKSNIIEYNGIEVNCSIAKRDSLVDIFNVADSRTEICKPINTDSLSTSFNDDENRPPFDVRISSPYLLQKKFRNVTTFRGSHFKRSKVNDSIYTYANETNSIMNSSNNLNTSENLIQIEDNSKSEPEDTKIMREKVEKQNQRLREYEADNINGQMALLSYEEKPEDVKELHITDDNKFHDSMASTEEMNNMTFQELCEIIQKSSKWSPVYDNDNSIEPIDSRLTFELSDDSLDKDCTIKRWQVVRDFSENESINKNEPSTLNESSLYSLYCPSEIFNCEADFQLCKTNTNTFFKDSDLPPITRSLLDDTSTALSTMMQDENEQMPLNQINCCDISSSLSIPSSINMSPCRSMTVQNKEMQTNEIANSVRKISGKEKLIKDKKSSDKFQVNPSAKRKYRSSLNRNKDIVCDNGYLSMKNKKRTKPSVTHVTSNISEYSNSMHDVKVIFKRDRDYETVNSLQDADQVMEKSSTSVQKDLMKNSSYNIKQCTGTLCHMPRRGNSTRNIGKRSKSQTKNRQYLCRRELRSNDYDNGKECANLNYEVKVLHHRSLFMESEAKESNETSSRKNSFRRQNNTTMTNPVRKTGRKQKTTVDNTYDTFNSNLQGRRNLISLKYVDNTKPIMESSTPRKYSHAKDNSSANYEERKSSDVIGDTTKRNTMHSFRKPLVSTGKYTTSRNEGKQSFIQYNRETTEQRRPQTRRYLPDNSKRSSRSVDDQVLSKDENKIIRNNNDTNKIISRPRSNENRLKWQTRELTSEKTCKFNNQTRAVNSTLKRSNPPHVIDTLKKIINSTSDNDNVETNIMDIPENKVFYYKTNKHQILNYEDTLETSQNNEQHQVSDQLIFQSIGIQTASKETLRHTQTTEIQATFDYDKSVGTSNDEPYFIHCKDVGASCSLTNTMNLKTNTDTNDLGNILADTISPLYIKSPDIVDDADKYFDEETLTNKQTDMTELFDIEIDLESDNYDKIEKIITPSTAINVHDNVTETKEIVCEDKSYLDEFIGENYDIHQDSIESHHGTNNTIDSGLEKVRTILFADTFCTDISEEEPTEHILDETMISAVSESKPETIPSKIFTAFQMATQHACNLQKAVMIHKESLMLQEAAKKHNKEVTNDSQISQISKDQYDHADPCREYISRNIFDGKYNSLTSSDSENSINDKYDIKNYCGSKINSKISCESVSFSSTSCNSNCQLEEHECQMCKTYCSTDYNRNMKEENTLPSQNINSLLISKSIPLDDSPMLADVNQSVKPMIYRTQEENALIVETVSDMNEENLKGTSTISGNLAPSETPKIEQDLESFTFYLLPFIYGIICIIVFWFFTIV